MKHRITLKNATTSKTIEVEDGSNLLQCIRKHVADFYAPCGGNGTCGKCRVYIPGNGHVTSCLYHVHSHIDVILPDQVEMQVLSSQYKLTKTMPLKPGETANLVTIPYGLAIDIGTTSMVFYFVNLLLGSVVDVISTINPQSKYGADVISRINYGASTPSGLFDFQNELIETYNNTIIKFCSIHNIEPTELVKISVVGNTTMLHNLLGIDALSIAHAPFTPKFTEVKKLKASSLGIQIHANGELVLSPSLSAYVGADIVAGLASINTEKLKRNYLFIDIGTNGEMVLVAKDKIIACATAAGPAFEGANISCGMPALPGAISEYNTEGFKVISDISPIGVCGSGIIDVVATMLKTGNISTDGNISKDIEIYQNEDSKTITITQKDIREVQLAKSAIFSGIRRMLTIADLSFEELDHVLLAGGFGNYLNIPSAIEIGLLPPIPKEKYIQTGNTAGSGAVLTLISENFIPEMEELKSKMEYIELSNDDEFTTEFAMNMFF